MSFSAQFGEKVNFLANIDVTKKSFEVDSQGGFKEKIKWSGIRNFFARAIYYISCTLIRPNPKIDQVALEFMQNAKQLFDGKALDTEDQNKLKKALSNLSKILHDNGGTKEGIINRFILTTDKITELTEVKNLAKPKEDDESLEALLEEEDEEEEVPLVRRNRSNDPATTANKSELDKLEEEYNSTKAAFDQRMAVREAHRKAQQEHDKTDPLACARLPGAESAKIFNSSDNDEFMLKLFEQKMLDSKDSDVIEFLTNLDVNALAKVEYSSYDANNMLKTVARFLYLLQKVSQDDQAKKLLVTFCKALPSFPEGIPIDILSQKQKADILADDQLQFIMRSEAPHMRFVLAFDTNNAEILKNYTMGMLEAKGVDLLLTLGRRNRLYGNILEEINPNIQPRTDAEQNKFKEWARERNIFI